MDKPKTNMQSETITTIKNLNEETGLSSKTKFMSQVVQLQPDGYKLSALTYLCVREK